MRTVYKYTFDFGYMSDPVEMPESAKFLKARMTALGRVEVWYEIDTLAAGVKGFRQFIIHATGQEIPHDAPYLDTVFDGAHVWHIFDWGWSEDENR